MPKVSYVDGPYCLACGKHEAHMVFIGPMVFCTLHALEFNIVNDEVDHRDEVYQRYLKFYKELL